MKILLSIETIESLEIFPYLGKYVDGIKINHLLWNELDFDVQEDKELFVDFKLWDTPNTMKTVVEKILEKGGTMTTISSYNNSAALEAVSEFKDDIKLLGVTYLTSWSDQEQYNVVQEMEPLMWRRNLQRMKAHGFSGVISSAHDIDTIRKWGDEDHELLNVCPGITVETPDGEPFHSGQVRTTSPKEAQDLGADYIVIGRAITESDNPVETTIKLKEEICKTEMNTSKE